MCQIYTKRYNNYMATTFIPLSPAQAKQAFALVEERVTWFENNGIDQWARAHYLSHYNLAYFENAARRGQLWGLFEGSRLVASAVLLDKDPRWQDYEKLPAWYVHNLAAAVDKSGAGTEFLRKAEVKARENKKHYLRLDCKAGAKKINAYYEEKGFAYVGEWGEDAYKGTLRQKKL